MRYNLSYPPRLSIFFCPSSSLITTLPFSSCVNSSKSSFSVILLLYSSSVPKLSGISKLGMMGAWSMSYASTLLSTSKVLLNASGTSAKISFISSFVLNHSCLEYNIRLGSSNSLPVLKQISRSCASAFSSSTKCTSFVHTSFTPYLAAS